VHYKELVDIIGILGITVQNCTQRFTPRLSKTHWHFLFALYNNYLPARIL